MGIAVRARRIAPPHNALDFDFDVEAACPQGGAVSSGRMLQLRAGRRSNQGAALIEVKSSGHKVEHPDQTRSHQRRCNMNFKLSTVVAAAAVIGAALTIAAPRSAEATPAIATSTGKPCGACHANPSGGGKLTGAGEKYKKSTK